MYGEVERCNWNADCVEKWNEATAAFNQLSPAEQTIELAVKMAMKEEEAQRLQAELAAPILPAPPVLNFP
jgi:hypothetical protein